MQDFAFRGTDSCQKIRRVIIYQPFVRMSGHDRRAAFHRAQCISETTPAITMVKRPISELVSK